MKVEFTTLEQELDELRGAVRILMDLHAHGAPISGQLSVLARLVGWDGFQSVERSGAAVSPEQAEQQCAGTASMLPRETLQRAADRFAKAHRAF